MLKRILAILLVLAMTAILAVGCQNSSGGKDKDVSSDTKTEDTKSSSSDNTVQEDKGGKLFGLVPQGRHEEAGKLAIEAFKKKYPKWEIEISAVPDMDQKVKIALGAGENFDFFWSGGSDYPQIWGAQNAYAYLDPYLEKEGIDLYDIYDKEYVDELKYDGKQVALPTDCFTYALYYNKVIFDKAGVPYPKPDQSYSYEELLEVGKKLTMDTDGDGKIDTWGIGLALPSWHIIQPWYNSTGARVCSPDGKTATGYIDSPEFIDFVTKYRDMMWKEKIAEPLNMAPDGDWWGEVWNNGFLQGNIAMHVSAPWMVQEANAAEEKNPDLIKWGTALPPRLTGDRPYTIGGTAGWAIASTCPENKRDMAFKFIYECAVGAGAEYWYDGNNMYATKKGLELFKNSSQEKYGGWVEVIKYKVPMEQIGVPAWKEAVEPAMTKYIAAAVLQQIDPAEACKKAAKEIDEGIKRYEERQ